MSRIGTHSVSGDSNFVSSTTIRSRIKKSLFVMECPYMHCFHSIIKECIERQPLLNKHWGCHRGRDRMVLLVGFATSYATSVYYHWCCEFESRSGQGEQLDTALCDKVCQWLATGRWFSPGHPVFSTKYSDRHDIAKILLEVALNTIKQTKTINKHWIENINSDAVMWKP